MFGINLRIVHNGQVILLRPFSRKDLPTLVEHFASMRIHMYTKGLFAQTLENEEEWYERNRKDDSVCSWAIQPEGYDFAIGTTSLHHLNSKLNSCSSGIIIWDSSWWNKGVASAAHLGRTLFAADYLNRFTINSSVRVPNNASRKALERVGYTIWGTEPIDAFRAGNWIDTHHLKWIHPEKTSVFFPDGTPNKYIDGVEKAKIALDLARKEVFFP